MSRWTTVGEVVAYEKGYTEGRADAIQRQWIPCTPETMPKESGKYLVTIRYEDGYDTDLFEYNSHWREWNDGELYGGRVIAWQPKPEPWKGGRR